MKEKGKIVFYIIPILLIIAGLCVIGYKAFIYVSTPDVVTYTYINEKGSETSGDTDAEGASANGIKYKLDDTQEAVMEDAQEETGGKNSDTAELEDLINELNEKAEEQTVIDP